MNLLPEHEIEKSSKVDTEKNFFDDTDQDENQSLLDKISGYAGKFNKAVESSRLPSLAGGFLQGAGDMGASIGNTFLDMVSPPKMLKSNLGIKDSPKIPHPNLEKYLPQDLLSKGAFLGGELGSVIPVWSGMQDKIYKLIKESKGIKRIGKEALSGSSTGYLLGENKDGDGRISSSLLGGIAIPSTSEIPKIGKSLKNTYEYISPKKISEESEKFREGLSGSKTETENIENLSKRVQFAEKSGKEEALPLKKEIYSKEGKTNLYKIKKESLPEGNLEKFAHMIEPGSENSENQINALQKLLKDYRTGSITKEELKLPEEYRKRGGDSRFFEKLEDIFGVNEFTPSISKKIEDILYLPTKRESKYFSDKKITRLYDRDLKELHNNFKNKPTLNNYDELQSALKKEMRSLKTEGKFDRKARNEHKEFSSIIKKLDKDKESFMQTLPENMQNLEKEFRKKWATGPAKYGSESKLTLQRLSSGEPGKLSQVTDKDVIKLFTRPDKNTLDAIKELGSSVGSHVIYSALNKVKTGDYKKMADTILDLEKKRGFEGFVTKDMIDWANGIKKRSKTSSIVNKGLSTAGGTLAGSIVAGPIGGVAGGLLGAGSPFLKKYLERFGKNK